MKYGVMDELDVIGAYYHYIQNSYFGTANGAAPCSGSEHPQCAGTFDAISVAIDGALRQSGTFISAQCSRK